MVVGTVRQATCRRPSPHKVLHYGPRDSVSPHGWPGYGLTMAPAAVQRFCTSVASSGVACSTTRKGRPGRSHHSPSSTGVAHSTLIFDSTRTKDPPTTRREPASSQRNSTEAGGRRRTRRTLLVPTASCAHVPPVRSCRSPPTSKQSGRRRTSLPPGACTAVLMESPTVRAVEQLSSAIRILTRVRQMIVGVVRRPSRCRL